MSIHPEEAARALKDAEAAADRSAAAVGYQRSSQYLILWGVVWAVGNVAAFLKLPLGPWAFPVLMLIGVVGSFIIGMRAGRDGRRRNYALQSLVIALAFVLFANGAQLIAGIRSLDVAEAVVCLAIGAGYMIMGVSTGWRMSVVGLVLMAAVISGWLYAREQFFLWMALAGGGGLILGGLWMRRV